MKKQLEKVSHDYIRYSNCWEDADILLEGLKIDGGNKVLSIGSAGDNSLFLLTTDPEMLVAVDVNRIQLNLIELKMAAFKGLDHTEMLEFLGFSQSERRLKLWDKIKNLLPEDVQLYWIENLELIEQGIIYQGKFERYFGYFRKYMLPLIHNNRRIDELFREKSADAQKEYFDQVWNNRRWRMLFKIFFSKMVMGRLGRDPEFLKEVEVPVSEFIFNKAAQHLASVHCQQNYFLHFILKGNFGNMLPPFARKENFEKIKSNIDKLIVFEGFAEHAFEKFGKFDRFNLSNIFEYMDEAQFKSVSTSLIENSHAHARFAYWNLMVPRRMSAQNDTVHYAEDLSHKLTSKDKGFFYSKLIVDMEHFDPKEMNSEIVGDPGNY